jgi:hypothetical protein
MIKLEFSNISELIDFVNLIRSLDDKQIIQITNDLNTSSDGLIEAEEKDENASTSVD